jgi:hypothetical protein
MEQDRLISEKSGNPPLAIATIVRSASAAVEQDKRKDDRKKRST